MLSLQHRTSWSGQYLSWCDGCGESDRQLPDLAQLPGPVPTHQLLRPRPAQQLAHSNPQCAQAMQDWCRETQPGGSSRTAEERKESLVEEQCSNSSRDSSSLLLV